MLQVHQEERAALAHHLLGRSSCGCAARSCAAARAGAQVVAGEEVGAQQLSMCGEEAPQLQPRLLQAVVK